LSILRDSKKRPFKVSTKDFEDIIRILDQHGLYSDYVFWKAPMGDLSPTLYEALKYMEAGGVNPGEPGITVEYLKSVIRVLGDRYSIDQIAAFLIHTFQYPCFDSDIYVDLLRIRKCIAIGGVDI